MFDFTSMYAADNACRAKKISRTGDWSCSVSRFDAADVGASQPNKKLKSEFCCERRANIAQTSTSASAAKRGCVAGEGLLLMGLVGDSLLEPFVSSRLHCIFHISLLILALCALSNLDYYYSFLSLIQWPTGSGCARGFLSAMVSGNKLFLRAVMK